MSIDEYFRIMQVKHLKNCKICRDLDINIHEYKPFRASVARFWQKAWFIWLLVLIGLVGAYIGFIQLIYLLVGSL